MLKKILASVLGRASNFQITEQFGFEVRDDTGALITPGYVWTHNRVVDQGLNYLLNAAFRGEGMISTWYIAPFATNVTPAANTTAQNFASTLTEFTNYTEPNRVTWVTDAASTALELINDAAPALFTIGSSTTQTSIYGGGLLSAQAKSSTSGVLGAAGKLPNPLLNLAQGFEVRLKYRLRASSTT